MKIIYWIKNCKKPRIIKYKTARHTMVGMLRHGFYPKEDCIGENERYWFYQYKDHRAYVEKTEE